MNLRPFRQSTAFDIGIAARSLRRSPGFTTAAIISLGLTIGAGVAGFGVLDAVRFRALPFPNAERLVLVSEAPMAGCPSVCDVRAGLVAAVLSMRLMQGLLYGTPTNDPVVYASVAAIALVVALMASYFPARRAARLDLVIALRAL